MKSNKNFIVVCNGEKPAFRKLSALLKTGYRIIAVDGGANHLLRKNIKPEIIIGDMDSITLKSRTFFKVSKYHKVNDQNTTDLEKAFRYLKKIKAENIKVFSVVGNRIDHMLSNLSLIKKFYPYFKSIEFVTNNSSIYYFNKSFNFFGKSDQIASIIPIGTVKNIKTKGFKFEMKGRDLIFGFNESQSNVIIKTPVNVNFDYGELFFIIND